MRRSAKLYATTLTDALHAAPQDSWPRVLRMFLLELVRRSDMKLLPKILSQLERFEEKREGRTRVTVRSAHPIDRSLLESHIQRLFPNMEPIIHEIQDPSLIGGVSFETRDRRFDLTLKRGLTNLRQTLIHS